jgi:hypothetical protein
VLAGGLLGGIVGPNLAAWTRALLPTPSSAPTWRWRWRCWPWG